MIHQDEEDLLQAELEKYVESKHKRKCRGCGKAIPNDWVEVKTNYDTLIIPESESIWDVIEKLAGSTRVVTCCPDNTIRIYYSH